MQKLIDQKIAILVDNGFEKSNVEQIKKAFEKEGAKTYIISPQMGRATSWHKDDWDSIVKVDMNIIHAEPEFYDALILPGGLISSDKLRENEAAIKFSKHFMDHKKPVGAIGYGLWLLVENHSIKGFKVTSVDSIQTDLINAGAQWENKSISVDQNLVSCKGNDEMDIFIPEFMNLLAKDKS